MKNTLFRLALIYFIGAALIILGHTTHNIVWTIGIYTLGVFWGFITRKEEQ